MNLGTRIRSRRERLGLTQRELAAMLGVTSQHVSAIEKDNRVPSLQSLEKIAQELGVTLDFLVSGKDEKESMVTSVIPAIKTDKRLSAQTKKVLIALVENFYDMNPEK